MADSACLLARISVEILQLYLALVPSNQRTCIASTHGRRPILRSGVERVERVESHTAVL